MKKTIIYIFFIFFITSCNNLEKQIKGMWVVEQAYIYNEPAIWDLLYNGFTIDDKYKCHLPAINFLRFNDFTDNSDSLLLNELTMNTPTIDDNDSPLLLELISETVSQNNILSSIFDTDEMNGTWKIFKEKKKLYLKISTKNTVFNRKFEVQNLRRERDERTGGYWVKMTLEADSLKIDCARAVYVY